MNVSGPSDDDDLERKRRHLRAAIGVILLDMPHKWAPPSKRGRKLNRGSANSLATIIGGDQHLTDIALSVLADHSPGDPGTADAMYRDPVLAACVVAASLHLAWRFGGVEMTARTAADAAAELRDLSDRASMALDVDKARSGAAASMEVRRIKVATDPINIMIRQILDQNTASGRPFSNATVARQVFALSKRRNIEIDITEAGLVERVRSRRRKPHAS